MFIVMYTEEDMLSENENAQKINFISFNELNLLSENHKLIVSCYFALTTLSTVGYGDYYPVSNIERVVTVCVMLMGVAFFSFIMGSFIEIISSYDKKMGVVDKSGDLHNWLSLLTRFNNSSLTPKPVSKEIESNFVYFWENDRLSCLTQDEQYLEALPRKLKN